jgi:hypothetical protein
MGHAKAATGLHIEVRQVNIRDGRPIVGCRETMRVGTMAVGMHIGTMSDTWHWRVTRRHVATELKQRTGISTLSIIFG